MTKPRRQCRWVVGIGLLAGLLVARPALAITRSATFTVTITVAASCTISANALHFGNYSGPQLDGTGTVTVTCTNGTHYDVSIDYGLHNAGSAFNWRMVGPGGAFLPYLIYLDAARTTVWGGSPGFNTPNGTGNGTGQQISVYGRIQANQAVTPGSYTDTLNFTLYY